ncbi:MAG TPA: glycerophosphodiester phosphodiesterase [Blastocatellia bacterium]|nr:glycerophosphodiester phosphodiesterase [Blastocatellia bacterium]
MLKSKRNIQSEGKSLRGSLCPRLSNALFRVTASTLLVIFSFTPPQVSVRIAEAQSQVKVRPLIIAHRGGAQESTENTIAAFRRAGKIGADGIETDIRLTRDGVVAVYHDDYFGRVEGLPQAERKRLVSDLTYSELSKQTLVPVGEDKGGRRVPTFDDLLANVKSGLLNIEIKPCGRCDEMISRTVAALKRFPELDRVVLEAHGMDTAEKLRAALGPRLKLQINPDFDESIPYDIALKQVLKFKPHSISVSYKKFSKEIVELAHEAGVEVWVWTVNSADIAEAMRLLGADAIKTDRPSTLLALFKSSRQTYENGTSNRR